MGNAGSGLLTVVVPSYNEAVSLPSVLKELTSFCEENSFQLVVVNDGSNDCSAEILAGFCSPCLRVLHHKVNRGYGGAIKSGVMAADTKYIVTVDADGQHQLADIKSMLKKALDSDADMVVGCRDQSKSENLYRGIGKKIIRTFARLLVKDLHVHDLNSGLKLYRADLALKYMRICPSSMAYSDVIVLAFVHMRHLVVEVPINIEERLGGLSTISTMTAVDTVREILNIVVLFNPMRVFIPLSLIVTGVGFAWGIPFALQNNGLSVGALLLLLSGFLLFVLGVITEQISMLRKAGL